MFIKSQTKKVMSYLSKIKSKFDIWSLYYRREIVFFMLGFITGVILF
jgi:regulator of RNase E activity RraB